MIKGCSQDDDCLKMVVWQQQFDNECQTIIRQWWFDDNNLTIGQMTMIEQRQSDNLESEAVVQWMQSINNSLKTNVRQQQFDIDDWVATI